MYTQNHDLNVENDSTEFITKKSKLERFSFIILTICILLTPIIFIPSTSTSLDVVKTSVISFGVLISSILYFIYALRNKDLYFPKNPIILIGIGIGVSLLISTFLSGSISKSFLGQGFEIGTASFIFVLFLSSLVTTYLVNKNRERVVYVFSAIIVSFIILFLYHLIRTLIGEDTLSFGLFNTMTASMIGKWSDFAVFAGLVSMLSYLGVNFLKLSRLVKALLIALFLISFITLVVANYAIVWFVFSMTLLGVVIYQYFLNSKEQVEGSRISKIVRSTPWVSVIFLVVSFIFLFNGSVITESIREKKGLNTIELALPWQYTIDIAAETVKESPLFGAGPNRFGIEYLRFKPLDINQTPLYEVEFTNGFALIPTFFVTQGLVGGILWVSFVALLIVVGVKELRKNRDELSRFFVVSTFFTSLFVWLAAFVYVPSHSIAFISFVLIGLFLSVIDIPRFTPSSRIVLPVSIFILVIISGWILVYGKKTIALAYFQSGISGLRENTEQSINFAESKFKKAALFDKNDVYYQALSEIDLIRINQLAQNANQSEGSQVDQAVVDEAIRLTNEALNYTDEAINIDPTNYYNYIAKARVLERMMALGIKDTHADIMTTYSEALNINRFSPTLYLDLARVELAKNNPTQAQQHIGTALQLKQNYIDAIFLLSQLQVSQGQIDEAIVSTQVATQLNPENPLLHFQLGLLYYNSSSFDKAIESFAKAVEIDNEYANAQYFLGLSYARQGKIATAVPYFETLATTNPENEEVKFILSNLKEGKSPFSEATPPIDSTPEQRKTLPIKEDN